MKSLCLSLLVIALSGCAKVNYRAPTANGVMSGAWEACSDDVSTSTLIELNYVDGTVVETISDYSNTGCTGTQTSTFTFSAVIQFPTGLNRSSKYSGGTDVKITPSSDLFSCASSTGDTSAYYFVKFSSDFKSFRPALNEPKCSASLVGSALNTDMTFHKK